MSEEKQYTIACFGEVLWDLLPMGKVAGGAPMNLAFHANNLGVKAKMISALGEDELGTELLQFLTSKQVETNLIQRSQHLPTSTVQVTLDEKGSASYEIVNPVAWDAIKLTSQQVRAVQAADVLLFGSLACRTERSRDTLFQLIKRAKKTIFDVNLRPPFYTQPLLEYLLEKAYIVKMNEEELAIIANWYTSLEEDTQQMNFLIERFGIETLIVTKGKEGAYCLTDGKLYEQATFTVEVADTVGAGDAFLAGFITKMLVQEEWQECLKFACATGAVVASKVGGTPTVTADMVSEFLKTY